MSKRDYSVADAAAMLGVSRQHVLGLVQSGQIEATKNLRGHYRISSDALAGPVLAKRNRDVSISTAEAAVILGISDRQVRRYCESGWIVASRSGHEWLIRPEALERFNRPAMGRPAKDEA